MKSYDRGQNFRRFTVEITFTERLFEDFKKNNKNYNRNPNPRYRHAEDFFQYVTIEYNFNKYCNVLLHDFLSKESDIIRIITFGPDRTMIMDGYVDCRNHHQHHRCNDLYLFLPQVY